MKLAHRRVFLQQLASATGAIVLVPVVSSCSSPKPAEEPLVADPPEGAPMLESSDPASAANEKPSESPATPAIPDVPKEKPAGWDPVAFNKERGNAGAIPTSYLNDINGPDGDAKHLGKHLPFFPDVGTAKVPEGYVALMWGDPDKGHARHPNAPKTADNPDGHWYNWIRLRKATAGEAEELESAYTDWPAATPSDNGKYMALGGGDVAKNDGKDTIYLAAVPGDVKKGDWVRIHAHCLTHGEYVDFVQV